MARPTSRRDQGASLVEFALILPVFMMLLVGMLTAGFALNEKQQMTSATREGARYATTVSPSQTFGGGLTWAEGVRKLIVDDSAGTLSNGDVCVSLVSGDPGVVKAPAATYSTKNDGTACIPAQPYSGALGDTGLRVQVTARKDAIIDLVLFGSYSLTMNVDATARTEFDS